MTTYMVKCFLYSLQRFELLFDHFDLEDSPDCLNDYLEMTANNRTQTYCGSNAPSLMQYDGPITLKFHSDFIINGTGFNLTYREIAKGNAFNVAILLQLLCLYFILATFHHLYLLILFTITEYNC